MTVAAAQELFAYNAWANRRIFTALRDLPAERYFRDLHSSHGGLHGTLCHNRVGRAAVAPPLARQAEPGGGAGEGSRHARCRGAAVGASGDWGCSRPVRG